MENVLLLMRSVSLAHSCSLGKTQACILKRATFSATGHQLTMRVKALRIPWSHDAAAATQNVAWIQRNCVWRCSRPDHFSDKCCMHLC